MGKLYELGLSLAAKLDPSLAKSFSSASKAVNAYDAQINALSRHQNNLDRVMKRRDATVKAAHAYGAAKQHVRDLAAQMRATKAPSAALKAEFEKAKAAASQTSAAFQKQLASLKQLQAATGMAGKSLKQLQAEEKQLALAAEKAARAQQLQQKIAAANNLRSAGTGRITSGMGQVAGVAAMGMAATAALKPGMDLEKQLSALQATSNLTAEQLKMVQDRAIQLGRDTVLSADQAAAGITKLVRAGYDLDASSKAMDAMGHIAVMTGKDFAEGTDIALQAIKAYKLDITDAGRVSDVFANMMAKSGLSADQVAEKLTTIGPAMSALGLSFEESAGMMAAMDKLGIKTEGLKKTITTLKAPTTAQAKALNALGVSAANADGSAKSMIEILQSLGGALDKLPEAQRNAKLTEIFGARDFATAKGLLDSMANGTLPEYIKAMHQAGTAEKSATKLTDNLAGDFQSLGSAIAHVFNNIYTAISPIMRSIVQAIGSVMTWMGDFIQEHQTLGKVIGMVAAAIGGVLAVLGSLNLGLGLLMWTVGGVSGTFLKLLAVFGKLGPLMLLLKGGVLKFGAALKAAALAVGSLGKTMLVFSKTVITTMITGLRALFVLMLTNPIGLIITAITALIAAGVLLYQNWDLVKAKAAELWGWLKGSFLGIWDEIKAKASELWSWFSSNFPGIAGFVSGAFDSMMAKVEAIKQTFTELISFVQNIFSGDWQAAWENAKNILANTFSGLAGLVKAPVNAVITLINKAFSAISGISIDVPEGVPMIGGLHWGLELPQIPQLAAGGIATAPTLAMVGEGQEKEAILPLSKLEGLLANPLSVQQAQPVSVQFSPTINIQGDADAATVDKLNQALRMTSDQIQREIKNFFAQQKRVSYA